MFYVKPPFRNLAFVDIANHIFKTTNYLLFSAVLGNEMLNQPAHSLRIFEKADYEAMLNKRR